MSLDDLVYEITVASIEKDDARGRAKGVDAISRYFIEKGEYAVANAWKALWKCKPSS